jgi:hypothetical protein
MKSALRALAQTGWTLLCLGALLHAPVRAQEKQAMQTQAEQISSVERSADPHQPTASKRFRAAKTDANPGAREASGAGVVMEGDTRWQQNGNTLSLHVDRVVNYGSGTTGSLRLELWATSAAYSGGTIRGYVLGSYQFSRQLGPNEYFYDINHDVSFTTPPAGTYYTTLTLEEYTGSGWVIRYYVTLTAPASGAVVERVAA